MESDIKLLFLLQLSSLEAGAVAILQSPSEVTLKELEPEGGALSNRAQGSSNMEGCCDFFLLFGTIPSEIWDWGILGPRILPRPFDFPTEIGMAGGRLADYRMGGRHARSLAMNPGWGCGDPARIPCAKSIPISASQMSPTPSGASCSSTRLELGTTLPSTAPYTR
ncbi:hypothetical protein TCAL_16077 [Tigriopus californicus]|uniref:Uncharacterized protein n=1 Tax=Tigriopus californicus TaxID=6832 RepID=A0A553PQG2_TIGCA|nr:hypothetical protein TCAL_16077 [Tigriopus californicus]